MTGGSDTKLGGAYVEITARMDRLNADLAEVRQRAAGLGGAFTAANAVAVGAIGAIAGALKMLSGSIKQYASLEAATATTNMVFGKSAKMVTDEANNMAKAFGVVKSQYLESANALGMNFKNMKLTQEQAAKLSMGLNQLAGDMAATFDKPIEMAIVAIQAALRGDTEALEKFGPQFTASRVEAEALRQGFTKMNGELTQAAKTFAALTLVQRESKDSQGAMVREADQLGSRLKKVGGDVTNMAAQLGGALAPAVNGFLGMIGDLGQQFSWIWTGMLDIVKGFSAGLGEYFSGIALIARNFGDVWQIARLKVYEFGTNVGEVLATVPENLSRIATWIGENWREMIVDALNAVWTAFRNLSDNIAEFATELFKYLSNPMEGWDPDFKPLLEGFKATTAQFPELLRADLTSLDKEIEEIGARINKNEADRLAARKAHTPAKLELNKQDFQAADRAQKAMMGGLKVEIVDGASNFARKLQEAVSGQGMQQIQKDQLDKQALIEQHSKETAEAIKWMADRPLGSAVAVLA